METILINKLTGESSQQIPAPKFFIQPVHEFREFTNEMSDLYEDIYIFYSFNCIPTSKNEVVEQHNVYFGDLDFLRNIHRLQLATINRDKHKFVDAYYGFGDDDCEHAEEFDIVEKKFQDTIDKIFDGGHSHEFQLLASMTCIEKKAIKAKGLLLFYADKKIARECLGSAINYLPVVGD